jgi:indolepyruvate ferredoxin oxidoreductase alpha subunit
VRATVSGDIGCYTLSALPPLESMDTCVCMGASIGIAQGLSRALSGRQAERIVAVLGDSTFIHAGLPSLVNAVYNKANITVIIADNRTTAMTGHQDNPGTGKTLRGEPAPELDFEAVAQAVGVEHVVTVDPLDLEATEKVVREAMSFAGPAVVVARRACVLVDRDQFAGPLQVDTEQCSHCKLCIRLGCPAISMEEDGAVIDQALCAGCELCAQQCPQEAISLAPAAAP